MPFSQTFSPPRYFEIPSVCTKARFPQLDVRTRGKSHDWSIHQPIRLSAVEMPLPRRDKDISVVFVLDDHVRQEIPEIWHVFIAPRNQYRLSPLRLTIKMNPRHAAESGCDRLDLLKCQSFFAEEPLEKFCCPALLPVRFPLARPRHAIPSLELSVSRAFGRGNLRRWSGDLRGSDGSRWAGLGLSRGSRENEPTLRNHDESTISHRMANFENSRCFKRSLKKFRY